MLYREAAGVQFAATRIDARAALGAAPTQAATQASISPCAGERRQATWSKRRGMGAEPGPTSETASRGRGADARQAALSSGRAAAPVPGLAAPASSMARGSRST